MNLDGRLDPMKDLLIKLVFGCLLSVVWSARAASAEEGKVAEGRQGAPAQPDRQAAEKSAPVVQLAILLDSSSSMEGLIRQAQAQLWKIVNEFALAKQDGKSVELQVALYEYGKNTLPAADKYIRKVLPLTTDLDKASQELSLLKANTIPGGDEYCGAVILAAVDGLDWSPSRGDLKVICIAGNEPFTQGPIDYRQACARAVAKEIIVNTIHCGSHETGASTGWKDGARLGEGVYASIDQDRAVAEAPAPQDAQIIRLGDALQETYVPFGASGQDGLQRQKAQDRNAQVAGGGAAVERAASKGSALYKADSWDLVDALEQGKVKLEDLKKEDLPEAMRDMSLEAQKKYIEERAKKRKEIRLSIEKATEARKKHLADLEKKEAASGDKSLGKAMIEALRAQGEKKGIKKE
jgi:hypothetical protein